MVRGAWTSIISHSTWPPTIYNHCTWPLTTSLHVKLFCPHIHKFLSLLLNIDRFDFTSRMENISIFSLIFPYIYKIVYIYFFDENIYLFSYLLIFIVEFKSFWLLFHFLVFSAQISKKSKDIYFLILTFSVFTGKGSGQSRSWFIGHQHDGFICLCYFSSFGWLDYFMYVVDMYNNTLIL